MMPLINVLFYYSAPLSWCVLPSPSIDYLYLVNCFTVHAIPATVQSCSILFIAMFINGDIGREWKIETYIEVKGLEGHVRQNNWQIRGNFSCSWRSLSPMSDSLYLSYVFCHPFAASLWRQAVDLPCVFYRPQFSLSTSDMCSPGRVKLITTFQFFNKSVETLLNSEST